MPKASSPHPGDLPHDLIRLARRIARDCKAPGTYTITLTVPPYKSRARTAVIARVETIRALELERPK